MARWYQNLREQFEAYVKLHNAEFTEWKNWTAENFHKFLPKLKSQCQNHNISRYPVFLRRIEAQGITNPAEWFEHLAKTHVVRLERRFQNSHLLQIDDFLPAFINHQWFKKKWLNMSEIKSHKTLKMPTWDPDEAKIGIARLEEEVVPQYRPSIEIRNPIDEKCNPFLHCLFWIKAMKRTREHLGDTKDEKLYFLIAPWIEQNVEIFSQNGAKILEMLKQCFMKMPMLKKCNPKKRKSHPHVGSCEWNSHHKWVNRFALMFFSDS